MTLYKRLISGAQVAPVFILFLYVLFICLDLFTTWLATPDLKYEANWLVVWLGLGWTMIIIKDIVIVTFMVFVFLISAEYLHRSFKNGIGREKKFIISVIFLNWKMFLSYVVYGSFYTHLIFSAFISVNNYFGYEYLYNVKSFVSGISNYYITNFMIGHPHYITYCQFLIPIPGCLLTILIIARMRKRYNVQILPK